MDRGLRGLYWDNNGSGCKNGLWKTTALNSRKNNSVFYVDPVKEATDNKASMIKAQACHTLSLLGLASTFRKCCDQNNNHTCAWVDLWKQAKGPKRNCVRAWCWKKNDSTCLNQCCPVSPRLTISDKGKVPSKPCSGWKLSRSMWHSPR